MASEFISGKVGYIFVDDNTPQKLGKWRFKPRAKILPRNNFTSGGFDESISGFLGGDLTIEGYYATPGDLVITPGDTYLFTLGIEEDGPTEFQMTARVSDAEISNDSEDGPRIVINAVSHGEFDPSTL